MEDIAFWSVRGSLRSSGFRDVGDEDAFVCKYCGLTEGLSDSQRMISLCSPKVPHLVRIARTPCEKALEGTPPEASHDKNGF